MSIFGKTVSDARYSVLRVDSTATISRVVTKTLIFQGFPLTVQTNLLALEQDIDSYTDDIEFLIEELNTLSVESKINESTAQANAAQNAINVTNTNNNTTSIASTTSEINVVMNAAPYLSGVSSILTPGGTNRWNSMTSNSFTLTEGTWLLFGACIGSNNNVTPNYTGLGVGFFAANGTNTSTLPAALNTVSNLTLDAYICGDTLTNVPNASSSTYNLTELSTGNFQRSSINAPTVRVTISGGTSGSIYMSANAIASSFANCRVWVRWYAQRIL